LSSMFKNWSSILWSSSDGYKVWFISRYIKRFAARLWCLASLKSLEDCCHAQGDADRSGQDRLSIVSFGSRRPSLLVDY
jgi:hypothetical protein